MLLRTERGFTLIELLLSLDVFLILTSLTLQIYLTIQPMKPSIKAINKMEWEIFCHNVNREISNSTNQTIRNNQLYLTYEDYVSSIEQYGYIVRRRVNNTGHETLLYNIKSFSVTREQQFITLKITDHKEQVYSATFFVFN